MKAPSPREFMAHAAIILAVCLGAWFMMVKSKMDELARLEHALQEQKASASSAFNEQTIEVAAKRMSAIRSRVEDIQSFNDIALDSSRLYGLIMELADAHAVNVHSLQPGSVAASASKPGVAAADESQINVSRLNMTMEGSYENVAEFLDAVCALDAFIRPANVQVMPSRVAGRRNVEATFGCDVLSFTLAGALAELTAANDDGGRPNVQP